MCQPVKVMWALGDLPHLEYSISSSITVSSALSSTGASISGRSTLVQISPVELFDRASWVGHHLKLGLLQQIWSSSGHCESLKSSVKSSALLTSIRPFPSARGKDWRSGFKKIDRRSSGGTLRQKKTCLNLISASISISQHQSAFISIHQHQSAQIRNIQRQWASISINQHQSAPISIKHNQSASASITQHQSAYQPAYRSAYSINQHLLLTLQLYIQA